MAERIRLSRAKGWRMPENTLKVDRSTKWGNPFIVGQDGTAAECVDMYRLLLGGLICLSADASVETLQDYARYVRDNVESLRGKNLGCWCALNKPCHADTLLEIANR